MSDQIVQKIYRPDSSESKYSDESGNLMKNLQDMFRGTSLERTFKQGSNLISAIAQDYGQLSRDLPVQLDLVHTGTTTLRRYISLGTLLQQGEIQLEYARKTSSGEEELKTVSISLPKRTHLEGGAGNWDASRGLYRGLRVELLLEKNDDYEILERTFFVRVQVTLKEYMLGNSFSIEFPDFENDNTEKSLEVVNTDKPLYKLGQPYYIQQHSVAARIGLDRLAVRFTVLESDLERLSNQ